MKIKALLAVLLLAAGYGQANHELTEFPKVSEKAGKGTFPLAAAEAARKLSLACNAQRFAGLQRRS